MGDAPQNKLKGSIRAAILIRKVRLFDWAIGVWHAIPYFSALFKGRVANPPSYVKFNMIRHLQKTYRISSLVETGTYYGDTCYRARNLFKEVISTEIDDTLFKRAVKRLEKYPNITIMKGDCVKLLPGIVKNQKRAAIYFLDAHYSGAETSYGAEKDPILQSLEIVSKSKHKNVILIDDLRTFDGTYVHISDLVDLVKRQFPRHKILMYNDMIVIHP